MMNLQEFVWKLDYMDNIYTSKNVRFVNNILKAFRKLKIKMKKNNKMKKKTTIKNNMKISRKYFFILFF